MTKKVYRTAQGKIVDLGSLVLQNENTRAVGNMGVNARGDRVDSRNRSVDSKTRQVARQYNRQTTNVTDEPVKASKRAVADATVMPEATAPVFDTIVPVTPAKTKLDEIEESGGLAAAIAKARHIKQEPLKTPKQLKQEQPGVSKI